MKHLFWRNILTFFPSIAALMLVSEVAIALPNINRNQVANTQPFNLVHLGYQGYFRDEGIPGYEAFCAAIKNRRVTAARLIESAIQKGRLDTDALNKQDYIYAVEAQLELILRR